MTVMPPASAPCEHHRLSPFVKLGIIFGLLRSFSSCCLRNQEFSERDLIANELVRQRRQAVVLFVRPAIFDPDILAFDKACFAQGFAECGDYWLVS
jgi:hypothetical protein